MSTCHSGQARSCDITRDDLLHNAKVRDVMRFFAAAKAKIQKTTPSVTHNEAVGSVTGVKRKREHESDVPPDEPTTVNVKSAGPIYDPQRQYYQPQSRTPTKCLQKPRITSAGPANNHNAHEEAPRKRLRFEPPNDACKELATSNPVQSWIESIPDAPTLPSPDDPIPSIELDDEKPKPKPKPRNPRRYFPPKKVCSEIKAVEDMPGSSAPNPLKRKCSEVEALEENASASTSKRNKLNGESISTPPAQQATETSVPTIGQAMISAEQAPKSPTPRLDESTKSSLPLTEQATKSSILPNGHAAGKPMHSAGQATKNPMPPARQAAKTSMPASGNPRYKPLKTTSSVEGKKNEGFSFNGDHINPNGTRIPATTDNINVPTIDRQIACAPPDIVNLTRVLTKVPSILTDLSKKQNALIRDLALKVNKQRDEIESLKEKNAALEKHINETGPDLVAQFMEKFEQMEKKINNQSKEVKTLRQREMWSSGATSQAKKERTSSVPL